MAEEVSLRLHGSGSLQGRILQSDVHVPAVCGGEQPLLGTEYGANVAPLYAPFEGRQCGHAVLVSSISVFAEEHLNEGTPARRLMSVEDEARATKERELKDTSTTWEEHSRLRRHHSSADILRHHTRRSYDRAPSSAWYQPFGQVPHAVIRVECTSVRIYAHIFAKNGFLCASFARVRAWGTCTCERVYAHKKLEEQTVRLHMCNRLFPSVYL